MIDEPNTQYDWYDTFQSVIYQAEQRNLGETEFSTCLDCVKEELEDFFDKEDMLKQGKAMGVTVFFIQCEKHAEQMV